MGTLFLDHFKKQASSFLQEKYKTARLTFTDVTPAELLAEEATNSEPCSPDAKTMTKIAAASFNVDDYWRVVDILHRRLYNIDWKDWRQSYKAMVLLEFLLTHGPEDFAEEFQCDRDVIQELGTFKYIDNRRFNWGACMQKKSDQILQLLGGGPILREARLKALKLTNEIRGFGSNLMVSSSSSSSPSSPLSSSTASSASSSSTPSSATFSESSSRTSFGSFSTTSSVWSDINELSKGFYQDISPTKSEGATDQSYSPRGVCDDCDENNEGSSSPHLWDCPPIQEKGSLLESEDEEDNNGDDNDNGNGNGGDEDEDEDYYEKGPDGNFISGMFSKLVTLSPPRGHAERVGFKTVSDLGREGKKKIDRQLSLWY